MDKGAQLGLTPTAPTVAACSTVRRLRAGFQMIGHGAPLAS